MAREQLLPSLTGQEVRDLRRHEARELRALPLDSVAEPCVRNGDRRLVGKGLDELDLLVRVWPRLRPRNEQYSNQLFFE